MSFLKKFWNKLSKPEPEKKEPVLTIFEMTADTACEFYELCEKKGVKTEEEKAKVLAELASKGKMTRVYQTKRTKEKFVSDLSKELRVLHIKDKNNKEKL
jgi:hypothetical protein